MTNPIQGNGSDALEETLGRLSKKAGVMATVVLDRVSGAILKTSGQIISVRRGSNSSSLPNNQTATGSGTTFSSSEVAVTGNNGALNPDQGVEELAAMVWNFVSAAGSLVQELDSEDEVKLLRLRTKKQELVIVPDVKYLLIVVHDTPPA